MCKQIKKKTYIFPVGAYSSYNLKGRRVSIDIKGLEGKLMMALPCPKRVADNKLCNVVTRRHITSGFKNQSVMWTQPDVAGWLDKRGGPLAAWKTRFFILQSSSLFYFKDNINIESAQPLGVVPLEGSTLEVADQFLGGAQRKWCVLLKVGPQFGDHGYPHILAAPSKQALEEWVEKFTTASKTHKSLLAQLQKSRRMASELRAQLSQSPQYAQLLETARGKEDKALKKALAKVKEELAIVQQKSVVAVAEADEYEGQAMRALTLYNILTQHLAGDRNAVLEIFKSLQVELDLTKELCDALNSKAGFFQGRGIEMLNEDGRTALSNMCEKALNNVLHKLAMISVKAPRYTSDVNPLIFPEHDSQFNHTSEIYDLYLEVKNSTRQRIEVDLEPRLVDKMLRTGIVMATRTTISSKLGTFGSMALKSGRTTADGVPRGIHTEFSMANPRSSSSNGDTSHQEVVNNPKNPNVEDKDGEV